MTDGRTRYADDATLAYIAKLEAERDKLVWSLEKAFEVKGALEMMEGPSNDSDWRIWAGGYIRSMIDGLKTACAALQEVKQ
jgi:hypothetical protein